MNQDTPEGLKGIQQEIYLRTLAAEQGYATAQTNLGCKYLDGEGVAQDDQRAIHWFRLAAEQGNAGAQFNLGLMYEDGRGVDQDNKQAH
jgi:uncharacterized protein